MNPAAPTELFSLFASTSWRAAWLILVLIVVRRIVRGRIPAQVWFTAWLVVAVRLLLPFSVPVAWSPYNYTASEPGRAVVARPSTLVVVAPTPPAETPSATVTTPGRDLATSSVALSAAPATAPVAPARRDPRAWLALAWVAGMALIAVARLVGAAWFRRQLAWAMPLDDGRVAAALAAELKWHGRGRVIAVLETDAVDAPALYGIVRPRLLFPPGFSRQLNDEELRLVVRHEFAHWRRRDLLAQTLMQTAVAVHWFNPLAWIAARLARTDCELACDEFVLRRESHEGVTAYGATLLKVLGVARGRRRPGTVVAIIEGKQQLAARVRMIADYRGATLARVVCGVALVAAVAATSLTRESHAAAMTQTTQPALPPQRVEAPGPKVATTASSSVNDGETPAYKLSVNDVIRVMVLGNPDLEREVRVREDGAELPLIGTVDLRDRTVAEAREILRSRYAAVKGPLKIDDPQVNIAIVGYAPRSPRLGLPEGPTSAASAEAGVSSSPSDARAEGDTSRAGRQLTEVIAAQRHKVDQLVRQQQNYKEKNRIAGFDQRRDQINENLRAANTELLHAQQALAIVEAQLQQVSAVRARGDALTTLPFIMSQPMVAELSQQLVNRKIELATLSEKYAERHPAIEHTTAAIAQTEKQLGAAIDQACRLLESSRAAAQQHNKDAKERFAQCTQDSLDFDRLALTYNEMSRELQMQMQILQNLMARQAELAMPPVPAVATPAPSAEAPFAGGFSISVMGAVPRQGAVAFAKEDSPIVLDAIARAGGFGERADRNAVRLMRLQPDGSRSTVVLTEAAIMAPSGADAVLRRGDVIVVPELPTAETARVSIFGAINNPGEYVIPTGEKLTLLGLLAKAGGGTRLSNTMAVTVKRTTKDGATKVFVVNAKAMMMGDEDPNAWLMQAGDVVSLPERIL